MVNLNFAVESPANNRSNNIESKKLASADAFNLRHIGPDLEQIAKMLEFLGFSTLDELIDRTVPPAIRLHKSLQLPAALTESAALAKLKAIASNNQVYRSFLGTG